MRSWGINLRQCRFDAMKIKNSLILLGIYLGIGLMLTIVLQFASGSVPGCINSVPIATGQGGLNCHGWLTVPLVRQIVAWPYFGYLFLFDKQHYFGVMYFGA